MDKIIRTYVGSREIELVFDTMCDWNSSRFVIRVCDKSSRDHDIRLYNLCDDELKEFIKSLKEFRKIMKDNKLENEN